MATVVAVVGTIAGAGTTTVVTALGTALGEQRRQVAVVDAAAEGSRLADVIGIQGDGDVTDALRRGTAIPEVQADAPHDLAAFPADAETNWGAVRPDAVDDLYDQLRDRFEFVLVDCGNEPSVDRAAWLGHADEVLIVTDPDVADAIPEIVALADAFDVPVRGVLASRVPPKEVEDAIGALDETGQPVLGVLPEDPTVGAAAESGTSVLRTEPDSPIATSVWEFALRFRQTDHDEPVVPTGTVPESMGQSADGSDGGAEAEADRAAASESDGASQTDTDRASETSDVTADDTVDASTDDESDDKSDASIGENTDATTAGTGESLAGESTASETTAGETTTEETTTGETTESTATDATAGDAFETPDPQPVTEDGSERGSQVGGDDSARSAASDVGGASTPDPSRAATGERVGDADSDAGRGIDDPDEDGSSGIGLDLGLSSDDEAEDAGDETGADAGTVIGREDREEPSDDGATGAEDDESAELSDEEIEAVFQETMQRVKERREQEEAERDE